MLRELEFEKVKWRAQILQLSDKQIYALVQEGRIPGAVKIGGAVRLRRDVVLKWLNESTETLRRAKASSDPAAMESDVFP